MPKTNKFPFTLTLLTLACALTTGCPIVDDDDPESPAAPDPIGAELLHWGPGRPIPGFEACSRSYLYRDGRALALQCFTREGEFSYENRGTLSPAGAAALDAEFAAADLDNAEPGDFMGFCGNPDSLGAILTVWVGDQSITYDPFCPIQGIESLNALLWTLDGDISDCEELDWLESVEPGCRAY